MYESLKVIQGRLPPIPRPPANAYYYKNLFSTPPEREKERQRKTYRQTTTYRKLSFDTTLMLKFTKINRRIFENGEVIM